MKRMKNQIADAFIVLAEVIVGLLMCVMFFIVAIVGVLYTFFKHLLKMNYSAKRQFKPIMRAFTLVNDCFANASAGELLNDLMGVKEGEIPYGSFQQTISSVTGLRYLFNNRDSRLRRALNRLHKDHCEKAPSKMELFYYKNKES